jgi:hypothetical protein
LALWFFCSQISWLSNLSDLSVPGEGYSRSTSYLSKVIPETHRTWWMLFQKRVVPGEGYSRNTSYLVKVIPETRRTWWRLFQKHVVPGEGYSRNALYALNWISTFSLIIILSQFTIYNVKSLFSRKTFYCIPKDNIKMLS